MTTKGIIIAAIALVAILLYTIWEMKHAVRDDSGEK